MDFCVQSMKALIENLFDWNLEENLFDWNLDLKLTLIILCMFY